jgi:hypothetical protein
MVISDLSIKITNYFYWNITTWEWSWVLLTFIFTIDIVVTSIILFPLYSVFL